MFFVFPGANFFTYQDYVAGQKVVVTMLLVPGPQGPG